MTLAQFKKYLSGLLYFSVISVAYAQDSEPYIFTVAGSAGIAGINGYLQIPAGGQPGSSSVGRPDLSELGIDQTTLYDIGFMLKHARYRFYLNYQFNRPSGDNRINENLISHNIFIPAGSNLSSNIKLDRGSVGGAYAFYCDNWDLAPLVELATLNFSYDFNVPAIMTESDRQFTQVTPRIGALASYHWNPKLDLNFKLATSIPGVMQLQIQTAKAELSYQLYQKQNTKIAFLLSTEAEYLNFKDRQTLPNHIRITEFPTISAGLAVSF